MNSTNYNLVLKLVGGDEEAAKMVAERCDKANVRLADAITRLATEVQHEQGEDQAEVVAETETPVERQDPMDYGESTLNQEEWDSLIDEVLNRVAGSDWANGVSNTIKDVGDRVAALETQVSTLVAANDAAASEANAAQQTATELVEVKEQLAQIEETVSRMSRFYEANQPVQRRVFVPPQHGAQRVSATAQQPVTRAAAQPAAKPTSQSTAQSRWRKTNLFK
jgi:archaellum component FlaC